MLATLAPLIKDIPFFKERGLDGNLLHDVVSCMEYCEVPKDEYVFEFGDQGQNYFLIIDGTVEVQIPDKQSRNEFD